MSARFLVVEGLIGVGKTSLCRLIEEHLEAQLVLEPCEINPFLDGFYADPKRYALPTQLFYLAERYQQQRTLVKSGSSRLIVADYLFEKDRIFAEQTLEGEEFKLYERYAGLLSGTLRRPDLVLFLDSPTEIILERIKRRGIPSEQVITADYLNQLRDRYLSLFEHYPHAPVQILNTSDLNYIDNQETQRELIQRVLTWAQRDSAPSGPASSIEREYEAAHEAGVVA